MQRQQMELIKCSFKEKNKELVQRNTIDQTLDSVTSPDNGYFSMEQDYNNRFEMASESMLQSTMQEPNEIEGGTSYIYEQVNEKGPSQTIETARQMEKQTFDFRSGAMEINSVAAIRQ